MSLSSGSYVAQLVRCLPLQHDGQRFEPHPTQAKNFPDQFSDSSDSLILLIGGIEHLVLSEMDDKIGGPVCTLRRLKNPWQLEIVKSRPIKAAVRAKLVPIIVAFTFKSEAATVMDWKNVPFSPNVRRNKVAQKTTSISTF